MGWYKSVSTAKVTWLGVCSNSMISTQECLSRDNFPGVCHLTLGNILNNNRSSTEFARKRVTGARRVGYIRTANGIGSGFTPYNYNVEYKSHGGRLRIESTKCNQTAHAATLL